MIVFNSIKEYIESVETNERRVKAIDELIDALLLKMIDVIDTSGIKEEQIDTGQTKVRVVYSNTVDLQQNIYALEKARQIYLNRLTGRSVRLIDSKNL